MLTKSNSINFESISLNSFDEQENGSYNDIESNEVIHNLFKYIDTDFFGHLKGKTIEMKKVKILRTYKYFFSFSMDKMKNFVNDPLLMLFTLQYIKDTGMSRIHWKESLMKNIPAYYRAVENMINES